MDTRTRQGFNVSRAFIASVKWFSPERAIGFGMLFNAVVIAFEPLRSGSMFEALSAIMGLDFVIVATWYLLGGIFLLHKGQKADFRMTLLAISPMIIVTVSGAYLAFFVDSNLVNVTVPDLAREVLINMLIWQRLLTRMTLELVEKFSVAEPVI